MIEDVVVASTEGELVASVDERIDALELAIIEKLHLLEPDLEHRFTPGLYIRTLRAPAGALATTFIHLHEHPFVVTRGVVMVSTGDGNWTRVAAPHIGITPAGTRRICAVIEDAEWTTFHANPNDLTDIDELDRILFSFRTLPDGTNIRDRFKEALARQAIEGPQAKEINP